MGFSPDKTDVTNVFPRISVTAYDDESFKFLRQSIFGDQIISNIISDNFYASPSASASYKEKYEAGISTDSKIVYFKIVVARNIQDTPGDYSSFFSLVIAETYGTTRFIYLPIKCVEKNQDHTIYMAARAFVKSDFYNSLGAKIFFSLVGDFNVHFKYPISITNTNASPSPISSNVNASSSLIAQLSAFDQYYDNQDFPPDYAGVSSGLVFSFTQISWPDSQTLFSTNNILFSTLGGYTKLVFNSALPYSSVDSFGITIKNSFANYSPSSDSYFCVIVALGNDRGELKIEPIYVIHNSVTGYSNIIFKLKTAMESSDFIEGITLRISNVNSSITTAYDVTYASFIEKRSISSFQVFSKSPSLSFLTLLDGTPIDLDSVNSETRILAEDGEDRVDNLIEFLNESIFRIKTKNGSIELPENTRIKTETKYKYVQELLKNDVITTLRGGEHISSIYILKPRGILLPETQSGTPYYMNGFLISNPVYVKNSRRILIN